MDNDRRGYGRRYERDESQLSTWDPKTKIGQQVRAGQITSIEQIFSTGKPIKEVEVVETLLPGIEDKVLEIASVQRMTKNNRKQKFRATVAVGDRNGHIGLGVGKDVEARPAIETGIRDAKKHVISVNLGCGSQECDCKAPHSLPLRLRGKCGSSEIILKPAPRGVGIVASETVRVVLELAGVKDVWTFSRGRTRDVYNMALATYTALAGLYELKNIEAMHISVPLPPPAAAPHQPARPAPEASEAQQHQAPQRQAEAAQPGATSAPKREHEGGAPAPEAGAAPANAPA